MFRVSSENLNLWQLVNKLKKIEDGQVELILSQNSPLLENLLAFKIIKQVFLDLKKEITFSFEDKNFSYLDSALNPAAKIGLSVLKQEKTTQSPVDLEENSSAESTPGRKFPWTAIKFRFNLKYSLLLPLILLLIFGGISSYYYYVPKTQVSLVVDSESLARAFEVTASASSSSVLASGVIIPAIEISAAEKKNEATASSGKKDLGDKALGTVTVYNKTGTALNLPTGTILSKARVDGDDLRFLTKATATIPARTVNNLTVSGYDPGTVTVDVAAESFGEDYNLPAGSTFNVGNKLTNEFIADNAAPFSGGTKRQATVVVLSDQKNLLESLTKKLKDELKSTLLAKLISGQNVDENSIVYEVESKNFDHNVGEEVANLGLTLEIKASAVAFSQSDLKAAVYNKLLSYIPDDYQLFGDSQDVEIIETKFQGKVLKILARGKGFIVPKIDVEEVKRKLLGKSLAFGEDYLKSLPNLSSFKIANPLKIGPFSFLPFRPNSLSVEVARR